MKRIELSLVILGLIALSLLAGCQQDRKVWGKGELPADYQETFGNSNADRLSYIQSKAIDRNTVAIFDPNGIIAYVVGLEARIKTLEDADQNLINDSTE